MRADIVAGSVFLDYELTDHRGQTSEAFPIFRDPDPMVLVLSRGGFCPKDRRARPRVWSNFITRWKSVYSQARHHQYRQHASDE